MFSKLFSCHAIGTLTMVLSIIITATVLAPLSAWLMSTNQKVEDSNNKLEVVSISNQEFERLKNMSIDELNANRSTFANPYSVGDYKIKVNLGAEGYFLNGKCGSIPSGKYANCINDTSITVYDNNDRELFTSQQLPLTTRNYSREDIDNFVNSIKTEAKTTAETSLVGSQNKLNSKLSNDNTTIQNEISTQINDLKNSQPKLFTSTSTSSSCDGNGHYIYRNYEYLYLQHNGVNWALQNRLLSTSTSGYTSACWTDRDRGNSSH